MRILYLYSRYWYDCKMSIGRSLYGHAVADLDGVELKFSGVGWPGWVEEWTVRQNIDNLGFEPDWIWVYKGQQYPGLAECGIPRFVIFNEANADKTIDEIKAAAPAKVGFHHEIDALRWKLDAGIFTLPHCSPNDDEVQSWIGRKRDFLFCGATSPHIYPLRSRLCGMMKYGWLGDSWHHRKHPGYRMRCRGDVEREYRGFRDDMRNSRFLLTCSSIFRYPLAKYIEAAHAGTIPVGDLPDDSFFQEHFADKMIVIDPAWSDQRISHYVKDAMRQPAELTAISDALYTTARRHFSMKRYAERVVEQLRK